MLKKANESSNRKKTKTKRKISSFQNVREQCYQFSLEEFIKTHAIAEREEKDYNGNRITSYLLPIHEEAKKAYFSEQLAKLEEKNENKTKARELRQAAQVLLQKPQKNILLARVIDPNRVSDSQVRVLDASTQEVSALGNLVTSVGQKEAIYVKYYGENSQHIAEIKTGNKRWRFQETNQRYTPRHKQEGEYDPPGYVWAKFLPFDMAEKEVRDIQLRLDCEHLGGENLALSEVYQNLKKDVSAGILDNQDETFDQMDEKEQKNAIRIRIKKVYPIFAAKSASIANKFVRGRNYQSSKFETHDKKTITNIGISNFDCLSAHFEKENLDELRTSIEKGEVNMHTGVVVPLRKKGTNNVIRVGFTFVSKGIGEGSILQAATLRNHKEENGNTKCDINVIFASLDNDGVTPTNIDSSRKKEEESAKEWNGYLKKPAFHLICWAAQTYEEKKSGKSIVRITQLANIP